MQPEGPCWLLQDRAPLAPLAEQPVLAGGLGLAGLGSPDVCVFCPPGCLPVLPDQVHTPEIQQLLRVPTLGLHAGLADGTLLHGLYSSLCHLHPPENQRTPETGTGIVVTGVLLLLPRWLRMGPREEVQHISPLKGKGW